MMSRSIKSKALPDELKGYPLFEDFDEALAATKPDAVSINSWPNSHAEYAIKAMDAGAHVFMEKPIATNNEDAERGGRHGPRDETQAGARLYPAGAPQLDEVHSRLAQTLGKPLVMRLNLNQQSAARPMTGTRT